MSIYQDANGGWVYFDGETKHHFPTQEEAVTMSQKESFVQKLQGAATQLAQTADVFVDLETVYFDRGYNTGGANAIGDVDIESTGLTAAQVASLITLGQQLTNFLNNQTVTEADYDATLNAARTDV